MFFEVPPYSLFAFSRVLRKVRNHYFSICAANLKSSIDAVFTFFTPIIIAFFTFKIFLPGLVPRRSIIFRLYVLQHSGIIYSVHGVIEPKVDRSELRKLTCN